ncbi:DEAD/DEAH box helicase [Sphaerisporangium sp. NPDC004334]
MNGRPMAPRPYQVEALDAVAQAVGRGVRRPLVVLPTGAGKTVTFAHLITRVGGRALIIAHRDELLRQARDKVRQVAPGLETGIVKAGENEADAQVVIASIQTLAQPSRREKIGRFDLVIVDEAHHAPAATYMTVLDDLGAFRDDGPLTVGFTATAGRGDRVGLKAVWQEIVYQRGILQMITEGYLCDIEALAIDSDFDLDRVATKGGDYVGAQIGAELERSGALELAAHAYKRYARDRKGIAFTPTVATAETLAGDLRAQGISAEPIDGTMHRDDRGAVLERLRTGKTQVVTNCAVLTEGFDEPSVSCVLMARPTKSPVLFVQSVGRGLRPYPGKDKALLIDVAGAAGDNGLMTIADLAGLPPGSVKPGETLAEAAERLVLTAPRTSAARPLTARKIDLFARSALRWLPLGDAFILPAGKTTTMLLIPRAGGVWDVYEHPRGAAPKIASRGLDIGYAMGVGEEIARARGGVLSRRDAAWRDKPPSAAQRAALVRMGYTRVLNEISTSGAASDLMARHVAQSTVRRLMAAAA